jgi:hypothetical protein
VVSILARLIVGAAAAAEGMLSGRALLAMMKVCRKFVMEH